MSMENSYIDRKTEEGIILLRQLRSNAFHSLIECNFSALIDTLIDSLSITQEILVAFKDDHNSIIEMRFVLKKIVKLMLLCRHVMTFFSSALRRVYEGTDDQAIITFHDYCQYFDYFIFIFVLALAKINIMFHKEI